MLKKIIIAAILAAMVYNIGVTAWADDMPSVSAHSALVMHSGGEVVFEKNADDQMRIASTTKIMTALVVLEHCALDEQVEILPEYCGAEGSSMYLSPGERYTVKELLQGLLLVSGNDAAIALACHTAGDMDSFVALMNAKAFSLGMENSSFANPHGLDGEGHYSTARDMAKLMCACMENEDFAEITATKSCTVGEQYLYNHNKLLSSCEGCIGGKTGYTEAAGRCLVSCTEREGTRYVCVTLSAPDDWNDHKKLYNWAFSHYTNRTVVDEGLGFDIPVVSGALSTVRAVPEETFSAFLPAEAELTLIAEMARFTYAPVSQGETAGRIVVLLDGELLKEIRLVYESQVPAYQPTLSLRKTLEIA